MATLSYSIRFGTGTWESINDICSGKEVAIVGNLCSNGFKSVADTASFVLRYTGSAHYVTVANSILTAQANNTDVFVRFQKVAGAVLFEGKVDLDKLSIKSTKIPTELSLSAKDYTYELDEAPKVNVVYDQRTVKQIVDGLLDSSTTSTSRKSVHTWPSDGLENLVPDVPMVITTDDKTTYRQRIDVLLQEMGGYVLNLDPSDGYYKVRKVVNDTVITASSDAVNYMVTDALVTDRSLWTNDGLVIKYPTVVRETEKKLVYTYMPSLKDATDGEHVVGDEIEVNAFWPKDGDLKATYQEFDTQYVDTAYNTNETREQNADLDLYYVDPGTGTTPDIDMKMVVSDSDFNRVSNWYSMPAVPSIYKEAGIQMYPRKTWILLKNTSGKKLNLTHFEIKGKPVYRSRVNHLIAPVDCSDPYEYEASYVATQSRVEALAQFMYNLKANSSSVSKWTDKWDAHNLGDKVKVQHKGHGTNGMGWLTCFIAAKSMKMIGDELYAEYTAVAISGWTALPQADNHTTLTSTGNTQDAYSQWLAQGNTGTREEWIASMKGEDGKGISSVEVKYGKTDGYVSGGHSDVEHETSEARIKNLKVYGGDEVHGESATSGGVATVGTTEKGKAWLKKVEGKSVGLVEMLPSVGTMTYTGTRAVDGEVYTFTNAGQSQNSFQVYTFLDYVAGHKYYLRASYYLTEIAEGKTPTFNCYIANGQFYGENVAGKWCDIRGILEPTTDYTHRETNMQYVCGNILSADAQFKIRHMSVIDLTAAFGSGNEPSLAECEGLEVGVYHSELESVGVKGQNLWDEEWEVGIIDQNTGLVVSGSNNVVSSLVPVEPSTQFTYICGKGTPCSAYYYGKDKDFLGVSVSIGQWNSGAYKTAPSNAYYVRFYPWGSSYGATYLHDIAIVRGTSGSYSPYVEPQVVPVQGMTLMGIGSAKDECVVAEGKVKRKVGSVDMGSLSWRYSDGKFYAITSIDVASSIETTKHAITARYSFDLSLSSDKTFSVTHDKWVWVKDSSYTDASVFKSAMEGVMLYYELAEPTTENITIESTPIRCEEGGTLTLNSGVAQAEGVFGIDSINLMDGLTEVQIEADNCLSWEDHEEDTSNGILALPSTEIAEWAEVEKVVGKTRKTKNLVSNYVQHPSSTQYDYVASGKVTLVGGKTYTLSCDTNSCGGVVYFSKYNKVTPSNGTINANGTRGSMTFTCTEDIDIDGYILLNETAPSGNVVISNLQIEEGTVATSYEAYFEGLHSSTLSSVVSKDSDGETLQSVTLPSLTLKGVGSACDTYTPTTGKVQRKVGSIDLGSLTWVYDSSRTRFRATMSDAKRPSNGYTPFNAICGSYEMVGGAYQYANPSSYNMSISKEDDSPYVYLVNLSKDGDSLSSGHASWLDGVTIIYEKTTSTEETSTTIDPYIAVEAGGSVSVVSTSAQAEATIHYLS